MTDRPGKFCLWWIEGRLEGRRRVRSRSGLFAVLIRSKEWKVNQRGARFQRRTECWLGLDTGCHWIHGSRLPLSGLAGQKVETKRRNSMEPTHLSSRN